MGKQWKVGHADLRRVAELDNRFFSDEKFGELERQLNQVVEHFGGSDIVRTLTRMVIEEVGNIINHNRSWHSAPLIVRSDFRHDSKHAKIEIIYAGVEYFDPLQRDTSVVVGSRDRFAEYRREAHFSEGQTHITIHFRLP